MFDIDWNDWIKLYFRDNRFERYVALRQKNSHSRNKQDLNIEDKEMRKSRENADILTEIVSLERDEVDKRSRAGSIESHYSNQPSNRFGIVKNR